MERAKVADEPWTAPGLLNCERGDRGQRAGTMPGSDSPTIGIEDTSAVEVGVVNWKGTRKSCSER